MEELQLQEPHGLSVVGHLHQPRAGELTNNRCFHVPAAGKGKKLPDALRRHGKAHALLGLGDEDLPRGEPRGT